MKLKTERTFDAAHYLTGDTGKCGRMHGHRFKVVVWVEKSGSGFLDEPLWDFRNLKDIIHELDHTNLNEKFEFNPCVENLAVHILRKLEADSSDADLDFRVRVYESPESYAEVTS